MLVNIFWGEEIGLDHSGVNFLKNRVKASHRNGPGTESHVVLLMEALRPGVHACVCMHTSVCVCTV